MSDIVEAMKPLAKMLYEQEIVNRYMRWKENALARYPLPSTANEQEKNNIVAGVFWNFFWSIVLDYNGNKTLHDFRDIIMRHVGQEEASFIDEEIRFLSKRHIKNA
jgi:hypothetical protein